MHPDNVVERRAAALAADLRVLAAPAFLALDLPPRVPVLGPVLVRGSVTLLRGAAGLGKSWLALSLAHAAASGGTVLGWSAPHPLRVLYVDAQMPLTLLQARLATIAGFGGAAPSPSPPPSPSRRKKGNGAQAAHGAANLLLLAAEAQAFPLPDLGAESGRAALMRLLAPEAEGPGESPPRIDLLVLDGLSALLRSARGRNDPAREFAEFLSALRRAGLCVLLVDRARTRKRMAPPFEDMLDAVITVKRPAGLGDDGVPHMAVSLSGRGLAGVEQFEARLVPEGGDDGEGEAPGWRRVARLDAAVLAAWRLERQGLSYRAIARALDVSVATAWRLAQKAHELDPGLLAAAAAEAEGELARADETDGTGETGETPETQGGTDAAETEGLTPLQRKIARLERAIWLDQQGKTCSPQEALRLWARVIGGAKVPPGVLFGGRDWRRVDNRLLAKIENGLEAMPPPDP